MLHQLIIFANSGCNMYAKFVFLSDILASILIPDDLVTTSVSITKILSDAGTHSGLAVKLKSLVETPTWNKAWLAVVKAILPEWYTIIHVH